MLLWSFKNKQIWFSSFVKSWSNLLLSYNVCWTGCHIGLSLGINYIPQHALVVQTFASVVKGRCHICKAACSRSAYLYTWNFKLFRLNQMLNLRKSYRFGCTSAKLCWYLDWSKCLSWRNEKIYESCDLVW